MPSNDQVTKKSVLYKCCVILGICLGILSACEVLFLAFYGTYSFGRDASQHHDNKRDINIETITIKLPGTLPGTTTIAVDTGMVNTVICATNIIPIVNTKQNSFTATVTVPAATTTVVPISTGNISDVLEHVHATTYTLMTTETKTQAVTTTFQQQYEQTHLVTVTEWRDEDGELEYKEVSAAGILAIPLIAGMMGMLWIFVIAAMM